MKPVNIKVKVMINGGNHSSKVANKEVGAGAVREGILEWLGLEPEGE